MKFLLQGNLAVRKSAQLDLCSVYTFLFLKIFFTFWLDLVDEGNFSPAN